MSDYQRAQADPEWQQVHAAYLRAGEAGREAELVRLAYQLHAIERRYSAGAAA